MSQRITRRLEIDAGHRLLKHEGKCRNYHGHRYVFLVTCEAVELDTVGRVVDFSVVKEKVGGWLDDVFDHGMIVEEGDPMIEAFHATGTKFSILDCPPTAENLSRIVFTRASELLNGDGLRVVQIECFETPNCSAVYP